MTFDDFLQRVAANIRKARWVAGMTQEQVAEHGFGWRHYQEIEAGQRQVTLRTLHRLANIFGTTVADLVETQSSEEIRLRIPLLEIDADPPKRGRKSKGNVT